MPSDRYEHKSEDLWQRYHGNNIDHDKYMELLEQLKNNELRHYKVEYQTDIESSIWNYEKRRQKERLLEAEQEAEAERIKKLPPLEKYKETVQDTVAQYRKESNRYRNIHNFFQGIIIIGSVLVTSATSAIGFGFGFGIGDIFKWIAPLISILVTISAGFTGYFKYRERSFNLQQTADNIEQEYTAVNLTIGPYKGKSPQEALVLFAERVEALKEEQRKREQQLEQPPDVKNGLAET